MVGVYLPITVIAWEFNPALAADLLMTLCNIFIYYILIISKIKSEEEIDDTSKP